ncbi:MAG: hypothetical protein MdMp024_0805 [Bacteroidales bacterium]
MGRPRMTEAERGQKRAEKRQAFSVVTNHLKYLSYPELEDVISLSQRFKREKLGKEELRLIKEKEMIDQRLQKLKELEALKK